MNFNGIMLSKSSQTQKATHCVMPFVWLSGKVKTIGAEDRSVVTRGYREQKGIDYKATRRTFIG